MTKTITICDRCGKEIPDNQHIAVSKMTNFDGIAFMIFAGNPSLYDYPTDSCISCLPKYLQEWLDLTILAPKEAKQCS